MTIPCRGTIIKTPDNTPGLLMINGRQKPFVVEGIWKSEVAPAVNMTVDAEFDGVGSIQSVAVVDPQQAAKEKLTELSGAAQERGKEAAALARQGFGALVARMGMVTLIGTIAVWIAWFFTSGVRLSSTIGIGGSRSITLWDALALDPNNNLNPGSHGFLSLVVTACVLAPLAAAFILRPWARYLYAAPLACLVLAWLTIQYEFERLLTQLQQQFGGLFSSAVKLSPDYGTYIIALASLIVAARVLKRRTSVSP